tara:strand:- start:100 stop:690 length:591 start_codon:yes stop_codon:yes gene_type:complete
MLPRQCQVALKEWAVTIQALSLGQQILLVRKGGIHEEGKDFRVIHPEFLLYSTFEHQREDLLQPESQPALRELLAQPRDEAQISFTHYAKVAELIEISDQEKVDDLSPHYIWTKEYAQSRLHWKPMLPLAVMLLRAYRMENPVSVPFLPEYKGCTSWVDILADVPLGQLQPVLSDEEFQRQMDEIKGSLGMAVGSS